MRTVYYDVENTLEVPFITGIQRVTREFSKALFNHADLATHHRFIPIRYDHQRQQWRQLTHWERHRLLNDIVRPTTALSRVADKIRRSLPVARALYYTALEPGAVFLDIDSSWHSRLQRTKLLPELKQAGLLVAKLHYDIIPLLFPQTTHPRTVAVFESHLSSHLQHADQWLCISQKTRDDVLQHCQQNSITAPPLSTIRLGTQPANQHAQHPATGSEQYGRYLLAVGTIEPRKNYPTLLRAFERVQEATDLQLVIVGKPGWLAGALLSEMQQHPLFGSRIHHLPTATDQALGDLYRNAWLTVVPSLYEGYGLPVAEALSFGCPTVCSTAGSLPEVGQGCVRFFSPESVDELADTILQLVTNNKDYAKLCTAARRYSPVAWSCTVADIDQCLGQLDALHRSAVD